RPALCSIIVLSGVFHGSPICSGFVPLIFVWLIAIHISVMLSLSSRAGRKGTQDARKDLSANQKTHESELLFRPLPKAARMVAAGAGGSGARTIASLKGRQEKASGGDRPHPRDFGDTGRLSDRNRARLRHRRRRDGAV